VPDVAHHCTRCGTSSGTEDDVLPLGWSLSTTARGAEWLCSACTREHARDIEAKLDEPWWS
jgi:hypothetical protein